MAAGVIFLLAMIRYIAFVYIQDKYYPIVGRVNMDALAISLGRNDHNFKVGDKVELISNKPERLNSAKNIAKNLQTIEYDIIATLNQRIIRNYQSWCFCLT